MIVMHGMFDLAAGVDEKDFERAFNALTDHLQARQLATGKKFMRQVPHAGYNARQPRTKHLLAIEFSDLDQAERCWSYVETSGEPVRSLHRRVNSMVTDARFFLLADVS